MKNNTLFVFNAEANKKKKWFTWGVRKLGVVKLVFREKHGPLRLLHTVLLPSQLLIKQWN